MVQQQLYNSSSTGEDPIPPMCGQAILTKVLRKDRHNDTNKYPAKAPLKIKNTRLVSFLLRNGHRGYDGIESVGHVADTLSPSSKASSSKMRQEGEDENKNGIGPKQTETSQCILQFDPLELDLIAKEKKELESFEIGSESLKKAELISEATTNSLSILWSTPLAPVLEEKASYGGETQDSANKLSFSATTSNKMRSSSLMENVSESSTSSSSCSYGPDSRTLEKELRDNITRNFQEHSSSGALSDHPDNYALLQDSRELILKQQQSLKELTQENQKFRENFTGYHAEMKQMRQQSTKQQGEITQLVNQKKSYEAETVRLKEEVKALRAELAFLKEEDDDLKRKFDGLMDDDTKSETCSQGSSKVRVSPVGSFEKEIMSISTANESVSNSTNANDSLWEHEAALSCDQTEIHTNKSISLHSGEINAVQSPKAPKDPSKKDDASCSTKESANSTAATMAYGMSSSRATRAHVRADPEAVARKRDGVALFKNRLDEIQRKRNERKRSQIGSPTSSSPITRWGQ
jgi:hypothetical protein